MSRKFVYLGENTHLLKKDNIYTYSNLSDTHITLINHTGWLSTVPLAEVKELSIGDKVITKGITGPAILSVTEVENFKVVGQLSRYDSFTWVGPPVQEPRIYCTGTLDKDGRVLVTGKRGVENMAMTLEQARDEVKRITACREAKANQGGTISSKAVVIVRVEEIYDMDVTETKKFSVSPKKRLDSNPASS